MLRCVWIDYVHELESFQSYESRAWQADSWKARQPSLEVLMLVNTDQFFLIRHII